MTQSGKGYLSPHGFSDGAGYTDVLIENGCCAVPAVRTPGWLEVGVYGGDMLASDVVRLKCGESALTRDLPPADPSPDIYSQLLKKLSQNSVSTATVDSHGDLLLSFLDGTAINAGRVRGEDGDAGYVHIRTLSLILRTERRSAQNLPPGWGFIAELRRPRPLSRVITNGTE